VATSGDDELCTGRDTSSNRWCAWCALPDTRPAGKAIRGTGVTGGSRPPVSRPSSRRYPPPLPGTSGAPLAVREMISVSTHLRLARRPIGNKAPAPPGTQPLHLALPTAGEREQVWSCQCLGLTEGRAVSLPNVQEKGPQQPTSERGCHSEPVGATRGQRSPFHLEREEVTQVLERHLDQPFEQFPVLNLPAKSDVASGGVPDPARAVGERTRPSAPIGPTRRVEASQPFECNLLAQSREGPPSRRLRSFSRSSSARRNAVVVSYLTRALAGRRFQILGVVPTRVVYTPVP